MSIVNAHDPVVAAAVTTVNQQLGTTVTVTPEGAQARAIRAPFVHPSDVMATGLRIEAFGGRPGIWAAHEDVADLKKGDLVTVAGVAYEVVGNLIIGGWRQRTGVTLKARGW